MTSMRRLLGAVVLLSGLGCDEVERMEPVPLERLPAGSLDAASRALPEVKFDRARRSKYQGKEAFEIIGRDKRGKTREVEVGNDGKILEIE